MEQKLVRVPFEVETAKKITEKSVEGRIVTREGDSVRILCWDKKDKTYPIAALVDNGDEEDFKTYTNEGVWSTDKTYTLKKHDLMLEIPEYMTFKDGDIYKTESGSIAIYNGNYQAIINNIPYYVGLRISDNKLIFQSNNYGFGIIKKCSLDVSEEEKQKLIDALKASKEPKAKKYLKRFFNIEVKSKCDFKVGQPVIGIDGRGEWRYDLFSHYKPEYRNGNYVCSARSYSTCLPYNEKTAHLIGTIGDWEE